MPIHQLLEYLFEHGPEQRRLVFEVVIKRAPRPDSGSPGDLTSACSGEAHLSEHLTSRRAVEKALIDSGVPVTSLRAAMIIGSGSASFEILRYQTFTTAIFTEPTGIPALVSSASR